MSTYSLFLDHNSPFNYYPYGDPYWCPDLKAGWAPWNDVTGGYDPDRNQSDISSGRFSHRTQQDNAKVELYFTGSSITLFGEVDQCNLDIWLDGASSNGSPENGRLAEFTGLERKEHRILITVHPFNNGSISFYGAQIDAPVESASSASLGDADISVNFGVDWVHQTNTAARGGTALGDYHETTKLGASINITLHQAAAVTVYGIRNLNAGKYSAQLDSAPPTIHIAKSSFETRSILYFATDLDATVDHYLVLTNIQEGSHFAVSSINTTTLTRHNIIDNANGSNAFSVPRGTAIALITAVVAAFIILFIIATCFFVRRRRRGAQRLARRQQMAVAPREVSPKYPSFTMNDETVTKSRHDPVILMAGSHNHSYDGSLYPGDDEGDEDDGSFQFVQRPLLGPTPSIRMPNLGPSFHVEFPSVSSVGKTSRKSSKRSTINAEHVQEQPMNRDTSDQTNFLHLQDSSGSTDGHSRHGHERMSPEREKHRSRVRFSTPPILVQLFRHPFGWAGGGQATRANRRSYQRSMRTSIGDEPTTPMTADSIPFTVGTSVAFEHPESTPPRSLEDAREESASDARDLEEGLPTGATDTDGFIPHSARPWRVVSG